MFRRRRAPAVLCTVSTIAAALILFAGSAAFGSGAAGRATIFACDNGARFSVTYLAGRAQITTPAGRWTLNKRPSSIGRKYSSDSATFIHDEDRAALNGLPGGPFRRCREAASRFTEGGGAGSR